MLKIRGYHGRMTKSDNIKLINEKNKDYRVWGVPPRATYFYLFSLDAFLVQTGMLKGHKSQMMSFTFTLLYFISIKIAQKRPYGLKSTSYFYIRMLHVKIVVVLFHWTTNTILYWNFFMKSYKLMVLFVVIFYKVYHYSQDIAKSVSDTELPVYDVRSLNNFSPPISYLLMTQTQDSSSKTCWFWGVEYRWREILIRERIWAFEVYLGWEKNKKDKKGECTWWREGGGGACAVIDCLLLNINTHSIRPVLLI